MSSNSISDILSHFNMATSSSQNDMNNIKDELPPEVWLKIFSYMGLEHQPNHISTDIKLLEVPSNPFIKIETKYVFQKEKFLESVENVYNFARCCKLFYTLTQRPRNKLRDQASWARKRGLLSFEKIIKRRLIEDLALKEATFKPSLDISLLPLESLRLEPLGIDKVGYLTKYLIENKDQESTENEEQSQPSRCQVM